ncbi:DUF6498-containing protein [Kangiella sediminilitoris]|uniref:Uncharacterized protein n=1 Tax=Kangiella sediminilitoris TaxID=1144748 RepID=A0A1B3BBV3_9GAMM|nr:DUF6498-containing protein [Kangiella sediminilitoris]AOE50280.1 hypothetical protein KS2013_1570 [Kangiella sediminilitoris]
MELEKISKGSIAIALGNAIPFIGVLLGYWSAFDLIFLYWFENIIIGIFAICRMTIRPDNPALFAIGGIFFSAFFCLHYGMFTYGHGLFISSFFEDYLISGSSSSRYSLIDVIGYMFSNRGVQLTLLAMFIAHLVEYIIAYRKKNIDAITAEMSKPYKRILVLHIAIIVGGFIATQFENSIGVALVIIAMKTYYDLKPPKLNKKSAQNISQDNEEVEKKIRTLLENPEIKINGKTHHFNSVEEMVNSAEYKKFSKIMSWLMPKAKRIMFEQALEEAIAKERRERSLDIVQKSQTSDSL